jgi:hypothetical protein
MTSAGVSGSEPAGEFAPDLESEEVVLAGLDGRADHEIGPTVGCTARSLEKGLFHSEWRDRHGRAGEARFAQWAEKRAPTAAEFTRTAAA